MNKLMRPNRGRLQWTTRKKYLEKTQKISIWVTSTVAFTDAAATGESFPAKGNPNAKPKA